MTHSHGFQLTEEQFIDELNSKVQLFRHVKSGAQVMSVVNDDANKCFGITFRTPPSDNTGVPHILEHSVLGGSQKYRVKEPFVELIKGSFKTFLNAMTFSDMTAYPVASTNTKDFYNLVDVYLDAVFNPLIEPHHLEQEGWHYEIENQKDPLIFKGVVFNEMKGSYSSPDRVMSNVVQSALFPDNAYRYDSGGDPKEIPNLTYEQFRTFHETYYHPSNAFIFVYGDDSLDERLELLNSYLQQYDAKEIEADIDLQTPFEQPRSVTQTYSVEADSDYGNKTMVRVSWALPEQPEPEMWMALGVLSYALMGTQASPLRKTLLDSGLGEDTLGGGFSQFLRQPTFSAGMRGIKKEDAEKVEALVLETLEQLASDGFDPELIEAALNSIEFDLRENNTGSFPRGLSMMFQTVTSWMYHQDVFDPLKYEGPLNAVKEKLDKQPDYLMKLIRQFLLDNTHRATVVLEPDPEQQAREEAEEEARLTAVKSKLTESDIDSLIKRTGELKELQSRPDDPAELAKIPRLSLDDLDKEIKTTPTAFTEHSGVEILHHDLFTNGIVYLEVGFNMHNLPQELLPYAKLYSRALTQIGLQDEDYVQLSQRIGRKTGGVYGSTSLSSKVNEDDASAWLFLNGKSTMPQLPEMVDIMRDILLTLDLDNQDRFRQMVLKSKARLEAGIVQSGHSVINMRLGGNFSEAGWAVEQLSGVSYLFFLRDLAERIESDWAGVLADLQAVHQIIVNQNRMICNVTLDQENWEQMSPQLHNFIDEIPPVVDAEYQAWNWEKTAVSEGLTIPAQVNYVGKGGNLHELGYENHGSVIVIRKYLRTSWLWEKIRVMGGAYGAFATFSRHTGVWSYLSYRDPNLLGSLENYDGTAAFLRQGIDEDELTKSIIGAISDLDSYKLPDAKGYSALMRYLTGVTDEDRQKLRDEVLNTTAADFIAFADYLDKLNDSGTVVVLGSSDAINEANEKQGEDWLEVTKVL